MIYKKKISKNICGTNDKPRLSIFKSNKHIYAQLINDINGTTLVSSSTLTYTKNSNTSTKRAALLVGEELAKKALAKNIKQIIYNRGSQTYYGRIENIIIGIKSTLLLF